MITVRQGVASDLHGARLRLEQRPELLADRHDRGAVGDPRQGRRRLRARSSRGSSATSRRSSATVFAGAVAPTERIYSLRREVTDFYRAVHPLLAPLATASSAARSPTSTPSCCPYFRDVHDHLRLVNEEVAAQRDLLATVLEANMAVISVEQTKISVRQNATIEQLTILATVFLPLTFVTGLLRPELRLARRPRRPVWDFVVFGDRRAPAAVRRPRLLDPAQQYGLTALRDPPAAG